MVHTSSGIIDKMRAPRYYGLIGRMWTCVYSYEENFSIPAHVEDHSHRDTVERCEPTQGANPDIDSDHAYLWVRLVTFFFWVTREIWILHPYAFSHRLPCTRDFKQYPAGPSERLLVLSSGPLSVIALCLPCSTGPLTHTSKHGTDLSYSCIFCAP